MKQPIPAFIPIRAAVLRAPGARLKIEPLEMEGPRGDELLVRIVASGICHTDIDFCEGGAFGPVVLGHEGVGVVQQVGRKVTGFRPGDQVVLSYQSCGRCGPCRHGRPADCERFWQANFGFARLDGTNALQGGVRGHFFGQSSFATYTLTTMRNTVKVPRMLPLKLLAPLGCGLQTGAGTVMNSLRVRAGASLAVLGVGSVGLAAVMAARIVRAETIIAVDIHQRRLKLALEFAVKKRIAACKPLAEESRRACLGALAVLVLATSAFAQETNLSLENRAMRTELDPSSGAITLLDKQTGVRWELGPPEATLTRGSAARLPPLRLTHRDKSNLRYRREGIGEFSVKLLTDPPRLEYSVLPEQEVKDLRLLGKALPVGRGENSYYAAAYRMGIQLRAEGDTPYSRRFRDSCSMAMFGAVKAGSALLVTWTDPYTEVQVDYSNQPAPELRMGLAMRERAQSVRLQPLGRGGYVEIAKAYRAVARERGLLKTLAEKLRENPRVAELFGAADFKPFAYMRLAPNTPWHEQDTWGAQTNFTFEECADLAEHLNRDLGIDRAMLVLNGWINGGYDNRHPDILPAAPEIGGNDGLAACSRRVKALGWLFGLHDNYQDMYRDAPSWNESFLIKNRDGSPRKGGVWAGGPCWLICSRKAIELANRPQNIPEVKTLFAPTLYFSDTIFAAGLYECFDLNHPTAPAEDLRAKQRLCDYLRGEFGLFGSEEGREWGVAHADYFEGLMSHRTHFQQPNDTDIIIPLFELVYGDAISIYAHQSDRPRPDNPGYILDHILYAEMPVYNFGNHRYWAGGDGDFKAPAGAEARLVFAHKAGLGLTDGFIKNTYEVLSPLNRLTALMPMSDHRFLTANRKAERTRFGKDVDITVNYDRADLDLKNAVLPQYGFLIESPTLLAFHARSYGAMEFTKPTMLVLRSRDGKNLKVSRNIQMYCAFGDCPDTWNGRAVTIKP